jgi:hypothetical protein
MDNNAQPGHTQSLSFLSMRHEQYLHADLNFNTFIPHKSSTHLWGEVIESALLNLGGQATTKEIYCEIEGKRPTRTKHWKAQIRKVLQEKFNCVAHATYSLEEKIKPSVAQQMGLLA